MKITSSGLLSIVYITERYNCQYPETILSIIKCVIHNLWTPKESNDITITINPYRETVCFSVKPARKIFIYTVRVNRNSKSLFIILDFWNQFFWSDISVNWLFFTTLHWHRIFVCCVSVSFLLQLWISNSSLCLWRAFSSSFMQRPWVSKYSFLLS